MDEEVPVAADTAGVSPGWEFSWNWMKLVGFGGISTKSRCNRCRNQARPDQRRPTPPVQTDSPPPGTNRPPPSHPFPLSSPTAVDCLSLPSPPSQCLSSFGVCPSTTCVAHPSETSTRQAVATREAAYLQLLFVISKVLG